MTLLSAFPIGPRSIGKAVGPRHLLLSELTIIVPVNNNPQGIQRLLSVCMLLFSPDEHPAAILIVDNLSSPPLTLSPAYRTWGLPVHLLTCTKPGAAAARNLGARHATTPWLLFLDSDCIPTVGLIDGYRHALDGSVAYAGCVRSAEDDPLSRYYETQEILRPLPVWYKEHERPAYLITANALVWRPAFWATGGFDTHFLHAAGEDIDLGLRLWEQSTLAFAPSACVQHTFEPTLRSFVCRFFRYGKGNRTLATRYATDLTPHPFVPNHPSLRNRVLALAQFLALWFGYQVGRLDTRWSRPLPLTPWNTTEAPRQAHLDQQAAGPPR
ncbi:hypothetical protein KSF_103460 [Reticulibacter mediterranei]|uniref:Glycosyltransferase 2-like domain-containing protein n=1 Tax=Reticulibacter mediterranei TaxID=2778369 RepID=A0A8J3N922_9CHLR|nr:glycosyltransferase [Reticulibacter mediterranei]GHP00299.1 hypothetical protein KSF_103460 [Reticulibacter mediterranei]